MGFWQYVVQFIICSRVCTEAVAKPNGHEEVLCSRGASFLSGETSACCAGSRESEESVSRTDLEVPEEALSLEGLGLVGFC